LDSTYILAHSPEQLAQLGRFNASVIVNSPGRVNLIGEHTDYNNGFVMPTAIDKTIKFYLKANGSESSCMVNSLNFDSSFTFDLKDDKIDGDEWTLYVIGVVREIQKLGKDLRGFDCLMYSDLPIGAGISSSAALECGLAYGLNALFDLKLSKLDIVKLSQKAEHNYVGTQCGIMDQFASVMSKTGNVIKLDCESLDYELIPFNIKPYKLLLLNTNVSHNLASSEYNVRRQECEEGVRILQTEYKKINSLRDVSFDQLETVKEKLSPVIYKRCLYILQENERVLKAAEALSNGDLKAFGALMYASHEGLQHKYEVSCKELDFLTDFSKANAAILGCRMMGGGFGGCTINLIHEEKISEYVEEVSKAYTDKFNLKLTAFTTVPANGSTLIEL
tara:strand:+ start:912 stop:2084 length:1173 start_codon:yes stop_codon:yes gene_type:complete